MAEDQARLLAMQTGRETLGEYGRRYRNVPLPLQGNGSAELE